MFDNIHIMWMCMCGSPYYVVAAFLDQAIKITLPSKMVPPTSMSNTYKMFDNLYMMWMCTCVSPYYHVAAALVGHA